MTIPTSLSVLMTATCNNCEATCETDIRLNDLMKGAKAFRERIAEKGWEPLMLTRRCVGLLCETCVKDALSDELEIEIDELAAQETAETGFPEP